MDWTWLAHRAAAAPGGRTMRPPRGMVAARVAAALVAVVLVTSLVAGCGSSKSASSGTAPSGSTSIAHAKTKFVLHAGLAFGAFHRWIYKPAKKGDFNHPLTHKLAVVKAAAAGLFTYHELKLALKDAQADPTLSKLVAPITALQNKMQGIASNLKSGNVNTADITAAEGSVTSIDQLAAGSGQKITDIVPSHL